MCSWHECVISIKGVFIVTKLYEIPGPSPKVAPVGQVEGTKSVKKINKGQSWEAPRRMQVHQSYRNISKERD